MCGVLGLSACWRVDYFYLRLRKFLLFGLFILYSGMFIQWLIGTCRLHFYWVAKSSWKFVWGWWICSFLFSRCLGSKYIPQRDWSVSESDQRKLFFEIIANIWKYDCFFRSLVHKLERMFMRDHYIYWYIANGVAIWMISLFVAVCISKPLFLVYFFFLLVHDR